MNEEMIRQMARMYNIPEEELIRMIMQGSPELSGIEAGYNEQQGVPAPGEPGRMSLEQANQAIAEQKAMRARPRPLDYMPPEPRMISIMGEERMVCPEGYTFDEAAKSCKFIGTRGPGPAELNVKI